MKSPTRENEYDGAQIEKILEKSGLLGVLRKYGEVSISKDNKMGAAIDSDINIQVVRDSRSRKKIPKIFDDIQRSTKFDSYRLANWDSGVSEDKQSGGHYISVSKRVLDKTWKVNIFLTKPKEENKKRASINISGVFSNLFGRMGNLNTSKAFLYVGYVLIAGFIFFISLGVLNIVYNGEFGFEIFSNMSSVEKEIIPEPEPVIEEPIEEMSDIEEVPDVPIEETDTSTSTETTEETLPLSYECIFNTNIRFNDTGEDVERLQKFLIDQNSEIYPDGEVTGLFNLSTREAVVRFQESYLNDVLSPWEISQGTGFVGTTTRAKINELCGIEEVNS